MSNLLVQNIKHTNGTTSMVVDSSGHVATDTIKGNSTAGSISVVGEGGSTTTNLQQGLAKAWGNHSGVNRNANDSLNIASTSDAGTGAGTYTFTNNMNGADYSVPLGALYNSSDGDGMHPYGQINSGTFSSSTFRVDVLNYDDTNDGDCNMVWTSVHGDLA
jgi:hypothetical protein